MALYTTIKKLVLLHKKPKDQATQISNLTKYATGITGFEDTYGPELRKIYPEV